jgi:hypothetical protein
MRPTIAASATGDNSPQTDGKRPPLQRIARFCHVHSRLSVTAKPRFKCSGKADVLASASSVTEAPQSGMFSVGLVSVAVSRIVGGGLIELAVERGTADFQPARNFGHLPAVMRDREADDVGLHFFERPHFT